MICSIGLLLASAAAAAPNLFTYQGRLKEGGVAVTANRTVEIFLCNAETGPTCTTTQAQPVAVANGLFRSTFTIPAAVDLGTDNWWLEIKIGADTLAPRERLTANAYALFAATAAYAEGLSAAPGSDGVYISSSLFVSGSDFSVDGATLVVTGGKVGIWTNAPAADLHVLGTVRLDQKESEDVVLDFYPSFTGNAYLRFRDTILGENWAIGVPSSSRDLVYRRGASSMANGIEIFRITSDGYVGISSATPTAALVISSAAGSTGHMLTISTGASVIFDVKANGEVYTVGKFIGDGSLLQNLPASGGAVSRSGDTMTGQLTLAGSSLTVREDDGTSAYATVEGTSGNAYLHLKTYDGGYDGIAFYEAGAQKAGIGMQGADDTLRFFTGVADRLLIDSSGRVGVGTVAPAARLDVIQSDVAVSSYSLHVGTSASTYHLTVTTSGFVGIGIADPHGQLHLAGGDDNTGVIVEHNSDSVDEWSGPWNALLRARGGMGAQTIVQDNDGLGGLAFMGYDGFSSVDGPFRHAAGIKAYVDGTPGAGGDDMPGRLEFYTTPDGTGAGVRRLTIRNDGNIGISTGAPQARLDVLAGGSTQTDMAQIWRDYGGAVISSVSATGVMMAAKFVGDGSGLTNYPGASALVGTPYRIRMEDATGTGLSDSLLQQNAGGTSITLMGGSSMTLTGYGLFLSTVNFTGNTGTLTNFYFDNAAANAGRVLKASSNGFLYWGNDSLGISTLGTPYYLQMVDAPGTGLVNSLLQQNAGGTNITMVTGSSLTVLGNFSAGGSVGIGTNNPNYKLDVQGGYINAASGLCIADTCKNSWASVADNLGNHTAAQNLNLAQYDILNVSSITIYGSGMLIGTDQAGAGGGIIISTAGALQTTGVGNSTVAGNPRGMGAVDLQTRRLNSDDVASGLYSVIGGGSENKASGPYAAVSGGLGNEGSQTAAFVGAGMYNTASGNEAAVGGGTNNTASGDASFVGSGNYNEVTAARSGIASGDDNTVSQPDSFIGGGAGNTVEQQWSVVVGGNYNWAKGQRAFVGGGVYNTAGGTASTVPGGWHNSAIGSYSFAAGRGSSSTASGSFTWSDSLTDTESGYYVENLVADRALFKAAGGFLVTGSTNTSMTGTLNRGVFITGTGLVGIATAAPQAALDVVANGQPLVPAQIWRDSAGVVVSSMNSSGLLTVSTVVATAGMGIGTNAPLYALDVRETIRSYSLPGSNGRIILGDGDLSHGMTGVVPTGDTFAMLTANSPSGGLHVGGLSASATETAVLLRGVIGNTDPNDSVAAVTVDGSKKNGVSYQAMGPQETVFGVRSGGALNMLSLMGSGALGISTGAPQAALDVKSTGTASNIYAQIWRDGSGNIAASVNSIGDISVATTSISGTLIMPSGGIQSILNGGAISVQRAYIRVAGSGGPVTLDAAISVTPGTLGQRVIIEGTSANTVTIPAGSNVKTDSNSAMTLGANDIIELIFNGINWLEIGRSVNQD